MVNSTKTKKVDQFLASYMYKEQRYS